MNVILLALAYLVGAFITKVLITIYDNKASSQNSLSNIDIAIMPLWFIALPLMLIVALFYVFYTAAQNLGDWICQKLK